MELTEQRTTISHHQHRGKRRHPHRKVETAVFFGGTFESQGLLYHAYKSQTDDLGHLKFEHTLTVTGAIALRCNLFAYRVYNCLNCGIIHIY